MKLKVHSLRVENTMTYNDRDDKYENNEFFILNCINNKTGEKYEVRLYTLYGDCPSGWCSASWGIGYIHRVNSFIGMTHKPIKELEFEIDENLINNDGRMYDIENDVFQLEYNDDEWYPSGSTGVNMNLFKEINRNKEKRPVWIFKGDSALGKSYLAGIIANSGRDKSVYETDAHEELGNIHEDIVVIGNKYKHSVEDVESHILGEHETILVAFSKA